MKKLGLSLLLILSGLCSFSYANNDYKRACENAIGERQENQCTCGGVVRDLTGLKNTSCSINHSGVSYRDASEVLNNVDISCKKEEITIYSKSNGIGCEKKIQCNKSQKRERIKKDFVDPDDGETISRTIGQKCTPKETPSSKDTDSAEKNAEDPTHVDHGLKCDLTRVMHGVCGMNMYNMLNIRQTDTETTATEFVQDFVLTATGSIGIVLTFALVVSGLMIIFGGANEGTANKGRQGIKYALVGYVIVLCSYTVVRLVQYFAAG